MKNKPKSLLHYILYYLYASTEKALMHLSACENIKENSAPIGVTRLILNVNICHSCFGTCKFYVLEAHRRSKHENKLHRIFYQL